MSAQHYLKFQPLKPLYTSLFFFSILASVFIYKQRTNIVQLIQFPEEKIEVTEDSVPSVLIDTISFSKVNDTINEEIADSLDSISIEDSIGYLSNGLALTQFVRKLSQTNDTLVRVLYIGDSQLEGDHVTYTLRKKLQEQFGGGGVGFMQLKTLYNSSAGITLITSDFDEESLHKRSRLNSKYGVFGKYYLPLKEESDVALKFKQVAMNFNKVNLYFSGTARLKIEGENSRSLRLDNNYQSIDVIPEHEMKLQFYDDQNFKIHAFSMDADTGIAVDNVPFRGVMNPNYYLQDTVLIHQMNEHYNVGLIVLHYGVNVVNDVRNSYSNYKIALARDVQYLKQHFPNSSIMIVSTSDMAHKVDNEMVSFENIAKVLAVQKEVSTENQVAFWNLYDAMGGKGSILEWSEKGWVRPDFVHLSKEGTDYIGTLMASDIIELYKTKQALN